MPSRRRIAGERRSQRTPEEEYLEHLDHLDRPRVPPAVAPEPTAPTPDPQTTPPTLDRAGDAVLPRERTGAGWWGSTTSIVALATALVVLTTLVVLGALGLLGNDGFADVARAERIDRADRTATAAAERAAEAVLAYDWRSLDTAQQTAAGFLTPEFAQTYGETFDKVVAPTAEDQRAVVTSEVQASAVIRASEDRVRVLVFVDQTTISDADEQPQVALNRVEMEMVDVDGSWLVDNITSY